MKTVPQKMPQIVFEHNPSEDCLKELGCSQLGYLGKESIRVPHRL